MLAALEAISDEGDLTADWDDQLRCSCRRAAQGAQLVGLRQSSAT
jgi:hypothetical protein